MIESAADLQTNIVVKDLEEQKILNVSLDMRVAATRHPQRPSYKAELAKSIKTYKNTKSVSP